MAYESGILAKKLQEKYSLEQVKNKVYFLPETFVNPWKVHLKESLDTLQFTITDGYNNGDLAYSSYATAVRSRHMITTGTKIEDCKGDILKYIEYCRKINQEIIVNLHQMVFGFLLSVEGKTKNATSYDYNEFAIKRFLETCEQVQFHLGIALYNYFQLWSHVLFEKFENSIESVRASDRTLPYLSSMMHVAESFFLSSLLLLKSDSYIATKFQQDKVTKNLQQLKIWEESCPENFSFLYSLVAAEKANVEGRYLDAIQLYEKSIASADKYAYTNYAALANELAGKFWILQDNQTVASVYLTRSYELYQKWGAVVKCEHFQENYSNYIQKKYLASDSVSSTDFEKTISSTTYSNTNTSTYSDYLDLASILKASQAISKEIEYSKLMQKLIQILLESAGAERVIFFTQSQHKQIYVEAEGKNGFTNSYLKR
ncbi:MAG: hypothetical protein AAF518_26315, partial [Spirochaetota bacterium]